MLFFNFRTPFHSNSPFVNQISVIFFIFNLLMLKLKGSESNRTDINTFQINDNTLIIPLSLSMEKWADCYSET